METSEAREKRLREQLTGEVCRLLDKFSMYVNECEVWCARGENSFEKRIVKQSFLENRSLIAAVFRVHELCAGKLNYFEQHWGSFEACRYDLDQGFIVVDLWDMEFIRHKASGKLLDLRYLRRMTKIEDFRRLCAELEDSES